MLHNSTVKYRKAQPLIEHVCKGQCTPDTWTSMVGHANMCHISESLQLEGLYVGGLQYWNMKLCDIYNKWTHLKGEKIYISMWSKI